MDLVTILGQQILAAAAGGDGEAVTPRLFLVTSRGVACRHDEVITSALCHFIGKSSASLLLAAYHSAGRYSALLDSHVRRHNHKMAAVELGKIVDDNESLSCSLKTLFENFSKDAGELGRILFIDDVAALLDIGDLSPLQFCQLVFTSTASPFNIIVLGYHADSDLESEHALLHMLRRRAFCFMDVSPLETGYTTAVDGQIKITHWVGACATEDNHGVETRTFQYHTEGRSVRCYPPGASRLVR